jgi:hypothetical protein
MHKATTQLQQYYLKGTNTCPFTLLVSYKHFNKNGGNKLVAWTQNSPKETIHDEQNTIKTIKPNEFPWNIQQ